MTPIEILESYQAGYDKEYKVKLPQVVTTEMDLTDDGCDGTMIRRIRMTDKETMMRDGYDEHDRKTYERYNMTIQPRKFYSETEAENFVRYIRRIAGRKIEGDEMMLLLRTITKGRQYELTCLIDRTEELAGVTKWVR